MSVVALASRGDVPRAAAADAAVRLDAVSKRFVRRRTWSETIRSPFRKTYSQALSNVTLEVPRGEFFGLLGPNGAGKSTLFKILATLVTPDAGLVHVNGYDAIASPRAVRKFLVPVVADERTLRWRLNARENLRLFAVLYRVPSREVWARVDRVLEIVGLSDTGAKLVGQFSTGMKQRLLIARALLARPSVLLLDEPTRGLDPLSARSLRAFLKQQLCVIDGCTVLLATHSAEEAFHLCDRVGVLDRGRLLTTGRAEQLMESYTEGRVRVWTRTPEHGALAMALNVGLVTEVSTWRAESGGWTVLELRVPGGPERNSRTLEMLVTNGMDVARFERVRLSLAELIERVQESAGDIPDA